MNFGRPNIEIGRKMANGRLLFLALTYVFGYFIIIALVYRVIHGWFLHSDL